MGQVSYLFPAWLLSRLLFVCEYSSAHGQAIPAPEKQVLTYLRSVSESAVRPVRVINFYYTSLFSLTFYIYATF